MKDSFKYLLIFSFAFIIIFIFPLLSQAALWSGILDPGRAIDWSQAGVPGGIPNRTIICATLDPGATADAINTAIQSCPSGQVVFLNAGTYNLTTGIDFHNKSNVTLRGAGPDKTFLVFTDSVNCSGMGGDICIRNSDVSWAGGPSNVANWTAGYAPGITQITLDNVANITPGQTVLILDQQDDANTDTGNIWVCQTLNVCVDEGPGGAGRSGRAQTQMVLVTAINGNKVTISPGLYMPNWRSSQNPGAWWANTFAVGDGVEDMSLDHTNSTERSGIFFFNAYGGWVKNIRSINANRNHVWLYQTNHSTVEDSYFYGTQNSASQSYGVETYAGTADNLIEDNIFQRIVAPMIDGGASVGTVNAYNYAINDYYYAPGWMMASNWLHAGGSSMILDESNIGAGFTADNIHGTHNFVTAFRNYFTGFEPTKWSQTVPIILNAFSRYMNLVGNVLGTAGYHNNYEWNITGGSCPSVGPSGSCKDTTIYRLGESPNIPSLNDPLVESTLLRWGNYDTFTNSVKWDTSEVPSGLSLYANSIPSTQTLPASFYLSSKPSWWGTMPWPAVGPDVAGGNISGLAGHAYMIPAQACYANIMNGPADGSGDPLTFNADTCYSGNTPPPPPPPPSDTTPPAVPTGVVIN